MPGDMAQIEEVQSAEQDMASDPVSGAMSPRRGRLGIKGFGKSLKAPPAQPDPDPHADGSLQFGYEDFGRISCGGEEFAAGLIWVSGLDLDSVKSYADQALRISEARAQHIDRIEFCIGEASRDAYGFGARDLGHERGMPVLIESLDRDILGENWLAVCPLSGGSDQWWVAGYREGDVFEDRIFASQADAAEAFADALTAPGWQTIICPDGWSSLADHAAIPREALLKPRQRGKLRLLDPLRSYAPRLIMAGVLLSVALGGGWYFYDRHQKHLAEMEEMRQRIERAITLAPQDHPWYHRTAIADFVSHCEKEIFDSLVMVVGWENQQFTCKIERGAGTVSTGWSRSGGDISWLRAAMPAGFPQISVHPSVQSATLTRRFSAPRDEAAMRAEPWSRHVMESRLSERFQVLGLQTSMRFVADRRPADTNPLFNRHDVQITGTIGIDQLIPMIEDIPAMIPETLNYNLASGSWSLVIRVHHPVILPEFPS